MTYKKLGVLTEEPLRDTSPSAPVADDRLPQPPNNINDQKMAEAIPFVYPSINTVPTTPKKLQSTAFILQSAQIQTVTETPGISTPTGQAADVDDFLQSLEEKTEERVKEETAIDFSELLANVDVTFKPVAPEKSREEKEKEFYSTTECTKPILIAQTPKESTKHERQMMLGA